MKVNINAKDFEKIEYLTYAKEINQSPTYLSVKREKKKGNNQTISNIKYFQNQFNCMYDYIPNKAEIIKKKKDKYFQLFKEANKIAIKEI